MTQHLHTFTVQYCSFLCAQIAQLTQTLYLLTQGIVIEGQLKYAFCLFICLVGFGWFLQKMQERYFQQDP